MNETELRCGSWEQTLANIDLVDAIITDPPYGSRTHNGHDEAARQVVGVTGQQTRRDIGYQAWAPQDVDAFVDAWAPRCRGWMVAMTSHDLIPVWEQAYVRHDRYPFAPLPWIAKRPRLLGDGPANWSCYVIVSRPRKKEFMSWGCLPGAYLPGARELCDVVGGKPLWLMRALVRDYSKPGDLICDPCAGGGTTLVAAAMEGRRAIGSEIDRETFDKATRRLNQSFTLSLF